MIEVNYQNQPFKCKIRTALYYEPKYSEMECVGVDLFYSAMSDFTGRYDSDNFQYGDNFYDYVKNELTADFALIDREGIIHKAAKVHRMHKYQVSKGIDDHLRINYGKGIVSNAFQFEVWCNSNRQFRFAGVDLSIIPRRRRSTLHAKGLRGK